LRVSENRLLRIFGPKREELTGGWKELHNEELHNLCAGAGLAWTTGVRYLAGVGDFSLRHRVQNISEAHPASYPVGTGGCFVRGKAARREVDH
jgi:hypothetical protein